MITPILVPKYIEGLHTRVPKKSRKIVVIKWLKSDGDFVADGEAVLVLDTTKAAIEMAAPAAGLLFHLIEVDARVKVGDTLGVIVDSVEEFQEYSKHHGNEAASDPVSHPV
jgi:pyruvate/2-oxoglutarate dehydrogenase complex dihydrolipoamide acyltransferase (E2) component